MEKELRIVQFHPETLAAIRELSDALHEYNVAHHVIVSSIEEVVRDIKDTLRLHTFEEEIVSENSGTTEGQTIYFNPEG